MLPSRGSPTSRAHLLRPQRQLPPHVEGHQVPRKGRLQEEPVANSLTSRRHQKLVLPRQSSSKVSWGLHSRIALEDFLSPMTTIVNGPRCSAELPCHKLVSISDFST